MTRTCDLRFRKPPSPEQLAPVHPFQNHRACSGVIPGVNLQKSKIYMLFQLSMAERVGFEPTVRYPQVFHFLGVCVALLPRSRLSGPLVSSSFAAPLGIGPLLRVG